MTDCNVRPEMSPSPQVFLAIPFYDQERCNRHSKRIFASWKSIDDFDSKYALIGGQ